MNNLGVLYDLGQGVEPDLGRALHWFAESAKTGHPSGMVLLPALGGIILLLAR